MIALDVTTLSVVNGLLVAVCGTTFLLTTLLQRNDGVGRLWSVFFIGLMFALFGYLVGSTVAQAWWAFPVANGGFVLSLGLLWAGARVANSRRTYAALPLGLAVLTLVLGILQGPADGYWIGALELFIAVAILTTLSAWEFSRGRLRSLTSARVTTVTLSLMTAYYAVRAGAFVVWGPGDPAFDVAFGSATSTLLETCLVVVAAMTLSSIQSERFRGPGETGLPPESGGRIRVEGMVGASTFRNLAESWLARSIRERRNLVLMLVDVADLAEINVAFGRAAGDAAIRTTGRTVMAHAPTAALVGHLSPRRFALLMTHSTADAIDEIGHRISESVLNAPIDDRDRFRATTVWGIATTHTVGARLEDLMRAASEAVALDAAAARTRGEAAREIS